MPLYGPKFTETEFKRGKNILASEHLQFIEAGATLDAEEFDKGFNGVGKAIAQNVDTGKFEPVADKSDLRGYTNFGILNVDFINDGETDVIAGEQQGIKLYACGGAQPVKVAPAALLHGRSSGHRLKSNNPFRTF